MTKLIFLTEEEARNLAEFGSKDALPHFIDLTNWTNPFGLCPNLLIDYTQRDDNYIREQRKYR